MSPYSLRLIGPFSLDFTGDYVELMPLQRRILALVSLSPGLRVSRERLWGLIWPDLEDELARQRLRISLHKLNRRLARVEGCASNRLLACDRSLVRMHAENVKLDTGLLMDAFFVGDLSKNYDGILLWMRSLPENFVLCEETGEMFIETKQIENAYQALLGELLAYSENRNLHRDVLLWAKRLLSFDPCDEVAAEALVNYFGMCGRRGRALSVFNRVAEKLQIDHGLSPSSSLTRSVSALSHRA